jgi:hypothetical protein
MIEKEYNNTFKFTLHQENVLLCEKAFNADQFNPFTRYSIDIRDILPRAITKLQICLSKKNYDVNLEVGRYNPSDENSDYMAYDLLQSNREIVNSYPKEIRNDLRYYPQVIVRHIDDKTIKGVECKIGFYINENPIVERMFYVNEFNPVARWSVDIVDAVVEITDKIFERIKENDIRNMWDDYDLINLRGLSINQIRELSTLKREDLLRKIKG